MYPTQPITFLIVAACLHFNIGIAQGQQMRQYHTQAYMEVLAFNEPELLSQRRTLEADIREHIRFQRPELEPIKLPIVVHILFSNTEERLSLEQIQSQLDALNGDFALAEPITSHKNDPYDRYFKRAVNTGIQFCYPALDPLDAPTTGINYIPIASHISGNLDSIQQQVVESSWNPAHYINVWVAALPDSISGYAQMPYAIAPNAADGIVIDYRYFGTVGMVEGPLSPRPYVDPSDGQLPQPLSTLGV